VSRSSGHAAGEQLEQNLAASEIKLSSEQLAVLSDAGA